MLNQKNNTQQQVNLLHKNTSLRKAPFELFAEKASLRLCVKLNNHAKQSNSQQQVNLLHQNTLLRKAPSRLCASA
jgi:hypothetical protein